MVPQQRIDQLRRDLSGTLLQPGDAGYLQAVQIDNGRVERHPTVIVFADSADDVALTMRFARDNDLPLTVLGGGHSAAGYCLNIGGVVVSLAHMNTLTLNEEERIVRVETGALWRQIYDELEASGTGLIPVGGGCPTVGIPGFMLGGGYSFVSRSYGMSVDNLLAIELVTPDGRLQRVGVDSKDPEDVDLFWACRGGGGGNFGVATAFEIRVHQPNTPRMLVGQIRYPIEQAQEVLGFYNKWVESLPDAMAVYGYLGNTPNPADPDDLIPSFGLTPIFNGDFAEGIGLIEPLLRFQPIYAELYNMTLPEWEVFNGSTTLVDRRDAYIFSGNLPPGGMTPEVIALFQRFMASSPSMDTFGVWTHAGGKISQVPGDATAFAHRDARFIFEIKAIWDEPDETRENVEWAYRFNQALEPYFQGAYVNYIDPLLSDWARKYYGGNLRRLEAIKRQVDPDGFFHFQQAVGSKFEPKTGLPLDLSPLNRTVLVGP